MNGCLLNQCRKVFILLTVILLGLSAFAQKDRVSVKNGEVTILVTAMPHNDKNKLFGGRKIFEKTTDSNAFIGLSP
jgi:hypothetical protein